MKLASGMRHVGLLATLVLILPACGDPPGATDARESEIRLRSDGAALRGQIASIVGGQLDRGDAIVIAVEPGLLRGVLARTVPFEVPVADRYLVRINRATASFLPGASLVVLSGRVAFRDKPSVYADLTLRGGLTRFAVEPESGQLTAQVTIDGFEVTQAALGGGDDRLAKRLLRGLAQDGLASLNRLLPPLRVPIRLRHRLSFSPTSGPVTLHASEVAIEIAVAQVLPTERRLWIFLRTQIGPPPKPGQGPPRPTPVPPGDGQPARVSWWSSPFSARAPVPGAADLERLRHERDRLRTELQAVATRSRSLASAPAAVVEHSGLTIGIPVALADRMISEAAVALLGAVELNFRDLAVHTGQAVDVKALGFIKMQVGRYDLDLKFHELRGRLKVGKPSLSRDGDSLRLRLPVSIASGVARAHIHFRWKGSGLAGAPCGDLDIEREVTGTVVPEDYTLEAAYRLALDGNELAAIPALGEPQAVRVRFDPSPESWALVDAVLAEKHKGLCGVVLDRVDVAALLREELGKGVEVRLPDFTSQRLVIPVGLDRSIRLGERDVAVFVRPGALSVTPEMLWYGSVIDLDGPAAPAAAPSPHAPPAK